MTKKYLKSQREGERERLKIAFKKWEKERETEKWMCNVIGSWLKTLQSKRERKNWSYAISKSLVKKNYLESKKEKKKWREKLLQRESNQKETISKVWLKKLF